jgi:O-antigen/teichoic acid export membrane protein
VQLNKLIYKNLLWRGFFYLTALGLNIGMARMLGADVSGELYFFLTNIYLVLLIGSLCLDAGITYYVSKKDAAEPILASFSLVWSLIVSVIIAGLFILFYKTSNSVFKNSFLLYATAAYSLGTFLNMYFTAFFYSYDNYKTPNLVAGIFNLCLLSCIPWQRDWPGSFDTKMFLLIFFSATLLQGVVIAILWFVKSKKPFLLNFNGIRKIIPVMKYSITALAGNFTYFILYRIDYWFVEEYCSAKSLGNYIQVSRLGQLLILPSAIIAGALFPQASKENITFETQSFGKIVLAMLFCYSIATVLLYLFGEPVILYLWGNEFDEMHEPLMIIMPGIIFLAVSYLFSPLFAGQGKVSYNVLIALLTLSVVVICNLLLVPVWGINGAAVSTSIGFLVMMILNVIIANRKFGFTLNIFSGKS